MDIDNERRFLHFRAMEIELQDEFTHAGKLERFLSLRRRSDEEEQGKKPPHARTSFTTWP
jgi:hypothetical protein